MDDLLVYMIHYSPLADRLANIERIRCSIGELKLITETNYAEQAEAFYSTCVAQMDVTSSSTFAYVASILDILYQNYEEICTSRSVRVFSLSDRSTTERLNFFLKQAHNAFSVANVELFLQHYAAIRHFNQSAKTWALILEDDVIATRDNTQNELDRILDKFNGLTSVPTYIDLGKSLGLVGSTSSKYFDCAYVQRPGRTRCSSSYLINIRASDDLIRHICDPVLPIDWCLSYSLKKAQTATYWVHEELFVQGSETGIVSSNQQQRNSKSSTGIWAPLVTALIDDSTS